MSYLEQPAVAACPACGVDCAPWQPAFIDCGWRDDDECEAGYRAVALMAHRYEAHRVVVQVGDLVRYWAPWRGLILGSEVFRVAAITEDYDFTEYARSMGADVEPMIGTKYHLTDPHPLLHDGALEAVAIEFRESRPNRSAPAQLVPWRLSILSLSAAAGSPARTSRPASSGSTLRVQLQAAQRQRLAEQRRQIDITATYIERLHRVLDNRK